jgi:hypothetical protein
MQVWKWVLKSNQSYQHQSQKRLNQKMLLALAEDVDKVRLYEFAGKPEDAESIKVKLTGALSQIRGRIEDTNAQSKMSVKALRSKLRDVGIRISTSQLKDMIDDEPLKNIIANANNGEVVFLGQDEDSDDMDSIDPDQSTDTLEKMAKRASKK